MGKLLFYLLTVEKVPSFCSGPAKKTTGDQPQLVTTPTSHPMGMVQPLTPDQQQWAAYQQQWAGYNYAQPQQVATQ